MAESFMDKSGRVVEEHGANHTCTAADSGAVMLVNTDGTTQTLPATAVGPVLTFQVAANGVGLVVSPNSADGIVGFGLSGTDDADVVLLAANARAGDFITVAGNGAAGWHVVAMSGAWDNPA